MTPGHVEGCPRRLEHYDRETGELHCACGAASKGGGGPANLDVRELVDALADCVVKATPYGTQDGEFVATYIMPTGPLHRAMPLLERYGVVVRPGFDGRVR